jgi:hypothetical protein
MKRFSRLQLILTVVCIAFLAISILFIMGYFQSAGKTPDLEKSITQTQQQIASLQGTCDINEATLRLEELLNRIVNESPFPAEVPDNTEVMNAIIGVVSEINVDLDQLSYKGESGIGIGETMYTASSYDLDCSTDEGREDRLIVLLELFEELRDEDYKTLLIEGVNLPGGEGASISFTIQIVTQ